MFYLAAYGFTNIGAFAVVTYFSRKGERYVNIDDFAEKYIGQRPYPWRTRPSRSRTVTRYTS